MRKLILFALLFCELGICRAAPPVCLYQDVLSGAASSGEGGNGIYLSIFGKNFGSSRGSSTVTVNGTPVAQYLVWGSNNDVTGEHDQISVQIASGTTGTGNIVVTTPGGSCSNLTFTVTTGKIYFIGYAVDNSSPGSCSAMKSANSYSSPWGLTNWPGFTQSTPESSYSYTTNRTPYTYYSCLTPGDTIVFLNGVNYHWFDGRGWHASFTPDSASTTSTTFNTFQTRPGATATLGAEGWVQAGVRSISNGYNVWSGLTMIGSGSNGGDNFSGYDRIVGTITNCPDCSGPAGAFSGGTGNLVYGNLITNVSTDTAVLPNGSNKTYHDVYFQGNNFEFAWNRIYNTAAYNGFQINEDGSSGFYNFAIHDNDIADVNGSGINLSDIDPSSGYVQVYDNIIHHTGINLASDGGSDNPHSCIAIKGYGSTTGAGTVEIYNNTMYDCSSYLNNRGAAYGEGESCAVLGLANQLNVTINLVNNIAYQPAYTNTTHYNVFTCGDGSFGTLTGSNNIWYSGSAPGSTAYATTVGTIENPLFVSAADGSWTNYELQNTSPAIGAGIPGGPVESRGVSSTYLTWDFEQVERPSSPAVGALEYGNAPSGLQVTVSASPSPATLLQPVTLTATVAQTGSSSPTGSINFINGSVSLGQASLDNEGTATLVLSSLSVGSYQVIAAYSGDSNYPAGQSAAASLQVLSTTTAVLTASPNPVSAGQSLTLTATLTGDGSFWPTGTITFLNGSTQLGTGTLNASGVATLSTTSLAPGTYSLTVQYGGDSNFLSSTSAGVSVTVNSQATTTSLTASPNPLPTGQTLTLTATVQGTGSTTPGGTVSFMNGSTLLGTATLNSSGVATLTTSSLATGTFSLTAQYAGNANFLSSTSAGVSVTVSSQATTTSLTASPNPVGNGQTLTLTADVQGTGSTTPGGTVSFLSGSTLLGTATLNSSGVATLTTTSLAAGTYSLTAQYAGNANFLASTSAAVSVTVSGQATTTSLTASPNPVATGQTLTLTATVQGTSSTVPGGAVSFMNGSTLLGTATLNPSGVATLTTTSLATGTYSLTAQYSGNANFLASTSAGVSVTVNGQATTTSLTASPNPVASGQTLTLTATVQGTGSTVPGGTVNFLSGSTPLGTAPVNSSGVATLTITTLAVGTYSLTAQYSGNANFLSSTSAGVSVTVNGQATTTSLTASPNPVATGQTLTLTAAVHGTGSTAPGGTVSFLSGSTLLGTATLNSSGVATLTNSSLGAGNYSLTAQYSGNASSLSSSSAAVSVTVNSQATTTSLTASPNPVATGQTLTLTAAVQGTGSTAPGGTISFLSGSTLLGTAALNSSGVATLTNSSLGAGNYSLTAQYSGNASFLSSTSAAVSVTVSSQATTTSLTASPNPVATGQTLTLTAAVQGTGITVPTGGVSFMSGSTLLGTAPLNSSGVATLTTTSLAAGTYSLTALYSGNASFLSSTSAAVSVTVNAQAAATTTSLTASPNQIAAGQTLTLTALVQGTSSTVPAGTVSFMGGSTPLGTAPLNSSGVATLTITTLAVGTYSITAQYSGNANFLSSTSAGASVTVYSQATTTSLTASPNPVATGQTLTLTAAVQGTGSTAPEGTVSFMTGSTPLGTAPLNSSGVATLTITTLAVGTYSLTAQYSGNASFLSSTSAAVSVTVSSQATATTTTLTASPNPVDTGQTLTLTAAVQGIGSIAPSGTVNFLNGSVLLGTATLNSSGVATLTTTSLVAETYSLTALYAGNASFLSSTSAAVSLTVNTQTTTTGQSFSLNTTGSAPSQTVQPGTSALYTLSVSPAPGATLPAITFTASGLPAGSTATFSPPTIAAGSGATTVTLSIHVPAQTVNAMLERNRRLNAGMSFVAFCILLLPFGGRIRRSGKRMLQVSGMVLLLVGAASFVGLAGCTAPAGQFSSQSAQTYTITVTTTSGSVSQTTNVTLIVE